MKQRKWPILLQSWRVYIDQKLSEREVEVPTRPGAVFAFSGDRALLSLAHVYFSGAVRVLCARTQTTNAWRHIMRFRLLTRTVTDFVG